MALGLGLQAQALPPNLIDFRALHGGLTDIQDGAYVEGSSRQGGIQPDYKIDLSQEPLKSLLKKCQQIGAERIDYWSKVGLVIELMREDFFHFTDYYNPHYRRLLKKYRQSKSDIPLHEYGTCFAGVCREHALVLHFALKAAGIENKHAYAQIYRASQWDNYEITEDHAFNVVEHDGQQWVVDSYYWGFNGFLLKDLQSKEGITASSDYAPIATPGPGTRKILGINAYPKVYNPVHADTLLCPRVI